MIRFSWEKKVWFGVAVIEGFLFFQLGAELVG